MSDATPLPFAASVKRFWPHVVPMSLLPSFVVVLLTWRRDSWAIALVYVVFAASQVIGMLPVLRRRAGFLFWLFEMGCSIVFAPLALVAYLAAYAVWGPPSP